MTSLNKEKRLNKVEIDLTPKEWVIRMIEEVRKYPSGDDYYRTQSSLSWKQTIVGKAWDALDELAEARFPGTKPDDIRARNQFYKKLEAEFYTLKSLIFRANEIITSKAETAGLKAALKLSTLQTVILQDAFGQTAKKAALWIQDYKTADNDDEENRQIMLDELAIYTDVSFAGKAGDSVPLGQDIRLRFPSVIEDWVREIAGLILDVVMHQAAIKIIQDKYFDGYPILFPDVENRLTETKKQ